MLLNVPVERSGSGPQVTLCSRPHAEVVNSRYRPSATTGKNDMIYTKTIDDTDIEFKLIKTCYELLFVLLFMF